MRSCHDRLAIVVKPSFWLVLAVCLLVVPLKLVIAWMIAAAFHEMCHIAVLRFCRVNINGIRIGFLNTEIETEPLFNRAEFLCALAGPVGSVLLISLHRFVPTIAFFAFIQALSNIIPVDNRDGGRIMRCLLVKCFGLIRGLRFYNYTVVGVKWLSCLFFVYICIVFKFILPILLMVLFYLVKIPCKARKQIVQY